MDKLSFLKWQLEARFLNGHIYERIKNSVLSKGLSEDDPYFYIYWKDLNRTYLKLYLMGTFGTKNEDYSSFIEWLNKHYKKDEFYEIEVEGAKIKIPIPFLEDYKCFKAEFLDIIMPSISEGKLPEPFLEGPYEYNDIRLKNGDTVFDMGANYGLFSSLALSKDCNVFAFEPTKRVNDLYLKRLEGIYPNLKVVSAAVSNKTGMANFYNFEVNSSSNGIIETKSDSVILVPTISIDEFVSQNKIKNVDFIKADIEGAERLMLEGATETLREFAPALSICYYHRLDDLKVLSKLILAANPNYEIEIHYKKIYAKVLKK